MLTLWLIGAVAAFAKTTPFEANILRHEGAPFAVVEGTVRNALRIHLINKTGDPRTFSIAPAEGGPIQYVLPQKEVRLSSLQGTYVPVLALLPEAELRPGLKVQLRIRMSDGRSGNEGDPAERVIEAPFVGPGI